MKKFIVLILLSLFLFSCGNVKDLKFTKDNQVQIMDKARNSKDITEEEIGFLMAASLRYFLSKRSLEGKTVGELINEQKKIYAEMMAR